MIKEEYKTFRDDRITTFSTMKKVKETDIRGFLYTHEDLDLDSEEASIYAVYDGEISSKPKRYLICKNSNKNEIVVILENELFKIVSEVAAYYHVEPECVTSMDRTPKIAKARNIAIYLCLKMGYSDWELCKYFKIVERSRIHFIYKKIKEEIETDSNLETEVREMQGIFETREELKEQIDELMRQYADEEIDGNTYMQKMLELTTSVQSSD